MKNFFTILGLLFLTLSCSSEDNSIPAPLPDKPDYVYSTKITPPKWLHGTWKRVYNGDDLPDGFRFYTDNFCHFDPFVDYCWKDRIESQITDDKFVQEISETRYKLFQVNKYGTVLEDGIYNEFIKKSDTEMIRIPANSPNMSETFRKQ